MEGALEQFASALGYITTTKVHPSFPFLIAPTLHAARISIAYQANARKSPGTLSWGTYTAGYLIMCWGGGLLSNFMLGLPPPMLYSFGPWINYLTVHLVLTGLFTFFPALLHPPTFDTVLFPLDALVRATSVVSTVSNLYPSSSSYKQINPLYVNSALTHMILGALASSGGGLAAGTLGAWTSQWGMSTPPVFRAGVGLWGSLDVWGGAYIGLSFLAFVICDFVLTLRCVCVYYVALVYGVAMNHPAFKNFLPTVLSLPVVSHIVEAVYPGQVYALAKPAFGPVEARALGGVILTLLFGLRAYYTHWAGASAAKATGAGKKSGKKAPGKA
ncbi:hypothetical protein P691DRAFT_662872 [Macrolepiota fuliginosa MF-IS2]|uniref:Uncharacterized protein n=1 Tax=Macrolepiota fuliginosa MF-IS2 TaxID=1400762 RepID=A0A9P6C7T3_9AGAR|nr:hypothetical protein P691DRAFT_662872 [Macrolepiota fuliginosa MF-IS2]